MVIKKIKKSSINLTDFVIMLIMFIGMFTGLFLWLNYNVIDSGQQVDEKYTETYNQFNVTRSEIDDNVNAIKDSFKEIGEADSSWQVAWNGFKALGETMKLPINFITQALQSLDLTFIAIDYIPEWAKLMFGSILTVFIVLLILALLKGEQRM